MKKKKLSLAQHYDIEVFGISTALKGYKLCWHLGNQLGVEFQKVMQPLFPADTSTKFDCYQSVDLDKETCYVIENIKNGLYYNEKYKIADFFFVKNIDRSLITVDNLKSKIYSISNVQTVFDITIDNTKDAQAFLIEM